MSKSPKYGKFIYKCIGIIGLITLSWLLLKPKTQDKLIVDNPFAKKILQSQTLNTQMAAKLIPTNYPSKITKAYLKLLLDSNSFCQIYREKLLDNFTPGELFDLLYENSHLTEDQEDSLLLAHAYLEKDPDEAMNILDRSNYHGAQFAKALYAANLMGDTKKNIPNYPLAIDLLEDLKFKKPKNAAVNYYLALIKSLAGHEQQDISEELRLASKGEYFDKHWNEVVLNIWEQTKNKPTSYHLIAATIQEKLNYPNAMWFEQMRHQVKKLSSNNKTTLANVMMKAAFDHPHKAADLYWNALDYAIGHNLLKETFGKENLIPPFNNNYMDYSWFHELKKGKAVWDKIEDPNSPCPYQEINNLNKNLEKYL